MIQPSTGATTCQCLLPICECIVRLFVPTCGQWPVTDVWWWETPDHVGAHLVGVDGQ